MKGTERLSSSLQAEGEAIQERHVLERVAFWTAASFRSSQ
jgi:hypothetical protein